MVICKSYIAIIFRKLPHVFGSVCHDEIWDTRKWNKNAIKERVLYSRSLCDGKQFLIQVDMQNLIDNCKLNNLEK